jgi:thiol-disulfide isomerase/thioredoxin
LSKPIEALIASMIASGPAEKRPPHIWFEVVSVIMSPGGNMRLLICLYTALLIGANAAAADITTIEALRSGSMKKLTFHTAAKAVPAVYFATADGDQKQLSDFQGKVVLLNFWATWCAPCRIEMPMLSELQTEFGGKNFEVVTIATGRNAPGALKRFFDKAGIENLPRHRDIKQQLSRRMAILGLPITVILNRQGKEIARLRGDADWSSDSAKSIISALIETE